MRNLMLRWNLVCVRFKHLMRFPKTWEVRSQTPLAVLFMFTVLFLFTVQGSPISFHLPKFWVWPQARRLPPAQGTTGSIISQDPAHMETPTNLFFYYICILTLLFFLLLSIYHFKQAQFGPQSVQFATHCWSLPAHFIGLDCQVLVSYFLPTI